MILTGAFAAFASFARDDHLDVSAQLAAEPAAHVLGDDAHVGLRNPQDAGAEPSRDALTPCVETHAVSLSPSHSQIAAVRFEATCASGPASSRALRRRAAAALKPVVDVAVLRRVLRLG